MLQLTFHLMLIKVAMRTLQEDNVHHLFPRTTQSTEEYGHPLNSDSIHNVVLDKHNINMLQ